MNYPHSIKHEFKIYCTKNQFSRETDNLKKMMVIKKLKITRSLISCNQAQIIKH